MADRGGECEDVSVSYVVKGVGSPTAVKDRPVVRRYPLPGSHRHRVAARVNLNDQGAVERGILQGGRVVLRAARQPERPVERRALNPDGICVMGHPGDDAFETVIDEAVANGIIVTSQNTTLPRLEGKYKGVGFGYVGQELYESGYLLGQEAVTRAGLAAGDRGMVWGLLSQPPRGLRSKGVIDALEEAGLTVDYIEIDDATNADPAAGTATFTGYVSANPDVKVVCTDHGGLTSTLETYLTAAGVGPDAIYGIGFDLSSAILEAIRGGWTDLVLDQQPYLQGYLPIAQICLTKKYKFSGLHIDTGSGFAHIDNVEGLAPLVEAQIR